MLVSIARPRTPESKQLKIAEIFIYTTSGSHHRIEIYDGNRTYYYLYMNNVKVKVGDRVTTGITILGEEGMAGDASGYHGKQAKGPQNPVSITGTIPSICPYDYI